MPADPKSAAPVDNFAGQWLGLRSPQEMLVDHGLTVAVSQFWKGNTYGIVKTIPARIKTVQHPLPSPARCQG